MSRPAFEGAAEAAVAALGLSRSKDLAGLLARGRTRERILTELATPGVSAAVATLYDAMESESVPPSEAAAYLRGYVAARRKARDTVRVRTVGSGPSTPAVPVRATAQVLVEVINEARHELLAMTYAARPYPALTRALTEAAGRGVQTHVVVETLAGAGGLLPGREPAEAFASVPGLLLWVCTGPGRTGPITPARQAGGCRPPHPPAGQRQPDGVRCPAQHRGGCAGDRR
ncbi:DISARM system phospholipase D-like protein DrmC [Streptomyces chartreusis]|uniref:DISARM system phospholipase D-like protein DrmC n=1 Tax=Streptomyces chartreusis TaxID=1969 RepID=UPI00364D0F53